MSLLEDPSVGQQDFASPEEQTMEDARIED